MPDLLVFPSGLSIGGVATVTPETATAREGWTATFVMDSMPPVEAMNAEVAHLTAPRAGLSSAPCLVVNNKYALGNRGIIFDLASTASPN